jgi:hypothetical protein
MSIRRNHPISVLYNNHEDRHVCKASLASHVNVRFYPTYSCKLNTVGTMPEEANHRQRSAPRCSKSWRVSKHDVLPYPLFCLA